MKDLDPRTKMMALISISCAALFTDDILMLAGLLLFTVIFMFAAGVSLKKQKKQFMTALGMVVFVFLLQALFGQWYTGAILFIRLLIIIMSSEILMTGQPRDYLLALIQCRVPYELAYMVILAFHFFPLLKEEAMDVCCSIQLRGTELRKTSIRRKLQAYKRICIPVLAGAFERARDTSAAMEARGFRVYRRRTYMRRLKMKKRDMIITAALPVLAALFVLSSCAGDTADAPGYQVTVSVTGDTEAAVSWSDDEKYDGILECDGMKIKATAEEVKAGEYYRYSAAVKDIEPDKKYRYRVGNADEMSAESYFSLRDLDSGEFTFMYMGDIQYQLRDRDYESWGQMLDKAYDENGDVSLLLFGGDMVEKGADIRDWEAFLSNGESVFSHVPVMTTIGNHETPGSPEKYIQMMSLPENGPFKEQVYSFDYGSCHFVSLNSCMFMTENESSGVYQENIEKVSGWLEKDLSESKAKWKVVYMHHPMYPVTEDDAMYAKMRECWEEILDDNGVDLVLCGHQHAYMRTVPMNGVTYIMGYSGAKQSYYVDEDTALPEYKEAFYAEEANYMIADVSDKEISITVYNAGGEQIDNCKIKK